MSSTPTPKFEVGNFVRTMLPDDRWIFQVTRVHFYNNKWLCELCEAVTGKWTDSAFPEAGLVAATQTEIDDVLERRALRKSAF